MYRLGNPVIQKQAMVIIRNFSLRSSIGFVLLNSEDFKQTVDVILMESCDAREKILVLETLLSIASQADKLLSKLKNSSLNRKLKDHLRIMDSDLQFQSDPENMKVLHLSRKLSKLLYPEN